MNKIFKISLMLLISSMYLSGNPSAEIYSLINPNDTLIHLGPCYIEDKLETDIILRNTGDVDLFMDGQSPSLIIFASPNQQSSLEFNQFNRKYPSMSPANPFVLSQGEDDYFRMEYFPSNPLVHPLGINEANIQISLLSVDDAEPANTKIFLVRVNKTDKFLAGYDNSVFIDSVYVNPVKPKVYNWKVKSTWLNNVEVHSQELFAQNAQLNDEITVSEYNMPIQFPEKYKIINWEFKYSPKDIGVDSSEFRLNFKPLPDKYPDSTDFISLKIYGRGVQQKLEISDANYYFSQDTINLGDVVIGREYNIQASIENTGNMNIRSKSENILNELNNNEYQKAEILKSIFNQGTLPIDSLSDIEIDFIPEKYGKFVYRYVIKTDIDGRNIHGVPESAESIEFYIAGRGVSPRLSVQTDTLDFKNIILNSIDCPSERDTILRISNNGNSLLRISDIITEPAFPQSKFRVSPNEMELSPGADTSIRITFISNDIDIDEFVEKLIFITNQYPPEDSLVVYLKAKTIPPVDANLSISRTVRAKPGSIVTIPVLIQNEETKPSVFATHFNTKIRYNSSILDYIGAVRYQTASENSIADIQNNNEEISINLSDNDFFSAKDTLILLKFRVYLGNAPSTELIFDNPVFGDNNCPKIMNTNVSNGFFIIDSVCGIDLKAVPFNEEQLMFNFYDNYNGSGEVIFTTPYSADVNIEIYDIFGLSTLLRNFDDLPSGNHSYKVNFNNLSSGVYLIKFNFDKYYITRKVLIGR